MASLVELEMAADQADAEMDREDTDDIEDIGDEELQDRLTLAHMFEDSSAHTNGEDVGEEELQEEDIYELAGTLDDSSAHSNGEDMLDDSRAHSNGEADGHIQFGTVEKFAPKRGYGIIVPDDGGEKLFAHWTSICSDDDWPQLVPGARVSFTTEFKRGRAVAEKIANEDGSPIEGHEDSARKARDLTPFLITGWTLSWNHAGFGFLSNDASFEWPPQDPQEFPAGSSFYVSREDVIFAEGHPSNLTEGMQVQFRVYKPDHKPCAAAEVTASDGSPLQTRQAVASDVAAAVDGFAAPSKEKSHRGSSKGNGKGFSGKLAAPAAVARASLSSVQKTILKPQRRTIADLQQSAASRAAGSKRYFADDASIAGAAIAGLNGASSSSSRVMCKFYREGQCRKGASCRFSHELKQALHRPDRLTDRLIDEILRLRSGSSPEAPPAPSIPVRPVVHSPSDTGLQQSQATAMQGYEAQAEALLQQFMEDTALQQEIESSLPPRMNAIHKQTAAPQLQQSRADGAASKHIPCRFFAEGRCRNGTACQFLHGSPMSVGNKKSELCKFYAQGKCTRGFACTYAHDDMLVSQQQVTTGLRA